MKLLSSLLTCSPSSRCRTTWKQRTLMQCLLNAMSMSAMAWGTCSMSAMAWGTCSMSTMAWGTCSMSAMAWGICSRAFISILSLLSLEKRPRFRSCSRRLRSKRRLQRTPLAAWSVSDEGRHRVWMFTCSVCGHPVGFIEPCCPGAISRTEGRELKN